MRSKHDVWANLMSGQTSGDSVRSAMSSSADNQLSANPETDQRIDYKTLYEIAKADGELYSSLLNASTDPIVVYDTEGRVKYVNAGFTKLFGWSFKDLQGIRIPFVPESEASITMSWIDRLYRGGEPSVTFETKRYTKDGSLLDINISASCYRDARGTIAGMLVILRDIT
ncbi:MAG: PAS domain-containing protein, partial [Desulfomonilaceae bacterium]